MLAATSLRLAAAGQGGHAFVIPWENPAMTNWTAPAPYRVSLKNWVDYPGWKAFDKNTSTYVLSRQGVPGNPNWWIQLDCGAPKRVTEITFTVIPDYRPRGVYLSTSVDDVTWTHVAGGVEPEPAEGLSKTTVIADGAGMIGRYWKFHCQKTYANHRFTAIAEIVLRGFE